MKGELMNDMFSRDSILTPAVDRGGIADKMDYEKDKVFEQRYALFWRDISPLPHCCR